MGIEGDDPRRIDVAVLSELPSVFARGWQDAPYGRGNVFMRDRFDVMWICRTARSCRSTQPLQVVALPPALSQNEECVS